MQATEWGKHLQNNYMIKDYHLKLQQLKTRKGTKAMKRHFTEGNEQMADKSKKDVRHHQQLRKLQLRPQRVITKHLSE
jgi:hypothetical protein